MVLPHDFSGWVWLVWINGFGVGVDRPGSQAGREGMPTDWSHRHVIFSEPSTFEQVGQITSDPRYWQQWYRQNVARALPDPAARRCGFHGLPWRRQKRAPRERGQKSWAAAPASAPATILPSIRPTSRPNCASCSPIMWFSIPDCRVRPAQASVVAYDNLYSGCTGTKPQTLLGLQHRGQVVTSPTISRTARRSRSSRPACGFERVLILLKWAPSPGHCRPPMSLTAVSTRVPQLHRALHDGYPSKKRQRNRHR
jgi:hypothetical protein